MNKRVTRLLSILLAAGIGSLTSPASAAVGLAALPQSFATFAHHASQQAVTRCRSTMAPAYGQANPIANGAGMDKSSAILGGQVSRLELMRRQQAGEALVAPAAAPAVRLAASSRSLPNTAPCLQLAAFARTFPSEHAGPIAPALDSEDFLASKRLAISRTAFDAAWNRVSRQRLGRSAMRGSSAITRTGATRATLAAVNAWANARIRYVEDAALYGRADYWASAGTTLRRGAGDCEDIAIVKLQMLAAAGVPRSDMYLTIARDLARNADHALLVVKLGGQHWLLDNATNELLDARMRHDYRPIMSFSADGKWLHGYTRLSARTPARISAR